MGEKNSGGTTMVNTFCSKRKDPSHCNSQISFPVMKNMEDLTHVHPILKKLFLQTKNCKMCPSREDKGISPSLETTDKRSRTLGFSRRLPNSSSNRTSSREGSKNTKFKSGITKTSRSGNEGNAGKGLHFKYLSLKRVNFEQFVSDQQKRWREPTSHTSR